MTTWNPNHGTQLGPAWQAIRDNLLDRTHGSRTVAESIAKKASGIQANTAHNLINSLIQHGYLTGDKTTIQLTPKGRKNQ